MYEKKSRQLFDDLLEKFSLISHTVKKKKFELCVTCYVNGPV